MSFYNLKELNIKLIDFSILLSPLGVVKKIVTNGNRHLFEINFHNSLNLYEGKFEINKKKNLIKTTPIKIFFEKKLGYIINDFIDSGYEVNYNSVNVLFLSIFYNPRDVINLLKLYFIELDLGLCDIFDWLGVYTLNLLYTKAYA